MPSYSQTRRDTLQSLNSPPWIKWASIHLSQWDQVNSVYILEIYMLRPRSEASIKWGTRLGRGLRMRQSQGYRQLFKKKKTYSYYFLTFLLLKCIGIIFTCIYVCTYMCTHMCVYTWMHLAHIEDNMQELFFSSTVWVLDIELRSSDLLTSTFTCWPVLMAFLALR